MDVPAAGEVLMRASLRGDTTTRAFLTIAVSGETATAKLAHHLWAAGLCVVEDGTLGSWRADGATVLHGVDGAASLAIELAKESYVLAGVFAHGSSREQAQFQPVWSVFPQLGPLGYELLVIDDDDASEQLETLYSALEDEMVKKRIKRSHMTISPRAGWQGYGHPNVRQRG
jgi:hypothetical protein